MDQKLDKQSKELTDAMDEKLSTNTSKIAKELRTILEVVSQKLHKDHKEIKTMLQKNEKEHKQFDKRITKLEIETHYLKSKIHI